MEEKTGGRIPASSVASISIQLLRKGGPAAVCENLCSLKKVQEIELDCQVTSEFYLLCISHDEV